MKDIICCSEVEKKRKKKRFKRPSDPSLLKYYYQRFRLFSLFDKGVKLDEVTPEKIASHTAKRISEHAEVVIDAFCGVGGNSIQFALLCSKDISAERLKLAKYNAKVYGVDHKIEFIHGDFMEIYKSLKGDAVFLSPPWGGPAYILSPVYDIKHMIPMDGVKVFKTAQEISHNIAYFLPKTTDIKQVPQTFVK